jgi:outer membrane protein assembly factor BamB
MAAHGERQRAGRVYFWVVAALVLTFGLFIAWRYFFPSRFENDPELLAKLGEKPLTEPVTDQDQVGQWPQWRGPNRDGVSRETGWLTRWPAKGPKQLWQKETGQGYSSVAVVGDRLYTMFREGEQKEVVVCWNADTGKQIWRYDYPGEYTSERFPDRRYSPGPRATPTVDGSRIFTLGGTGILTCLEASSGTKVWQKDLFKDFHVKEYVWGASCSPLVVGERVFVNPGGSNGNSVAAFKKGTGELAWKNLDDGPGYSSPVAMTVEGIPQILFFTMEGLVSVHPETGKLHWRYEWKTRYDCNIATPLVVDNYVFISSNYNKGCAVVEVAKDSSGKLQGRPVYAGDQMCNHYCTSVRHKDHIYGFNDTQLTCMEFKTGKVRWHKGGFKKGSLIIADGHLIVLGADGRLAVARASPEEFRPISEFKIRGVFWNIPVLAGGRLYVRDEENLTCFDLRKPKEG